MKKNLLLLLLIGMAGILPAQTVVYLKLPAPCSVTEIKEYKQEKSFDFIVYPNPAKDNLMIDISAKDEIGKVKIEMVNMLGLNVFSEQIYSANDSCVKTINVSGLSPGIYAVIVIRENERLSKKLIIK